VMPCGLSCAEAERDAAAHASRLAGLGADRAFAVDAAGSFSRPGPRIADGVELLGHLLHPDAVAAPDGLAFAELRGRGL
jgi:iron complex transport system substrate-binding protein